jgi:hypothetical protein
MCPWHMPLWQGNTWGPKDGVQHADLLQARHYYLVNDTALEAEVAGFCVATKAFSIHLR